MGWARVFCYLQNWLTEQLIFRREENGKTASRICEVEGSLATPTPTLQSQALKINVLIVNKGKKLGFLPEENISISQVINNPKLLAYQEFGEITKFNAIDKLEDQEIEQLLESGQKVIMGLKAELEKSKKTVKDCQDELLPYLYLIRRIKAAKKWHETLKRREFGQVEIELPEETPLLKKLRDAVQFMCFWKGIEYADVCVDAIGNYLPIKETCERHLRLMLRKGKCDLKPTYNFEVTIDGKIQFLSRKQVTSRLEKGNFWLSREKYRLFNDREYYDYK